MELRITGNNVEVTSTERDYIQKKLGRLTHHLANITEALVEVTEQKTRDPQFRYVVQATINIKGTLLRAEERAPQLAPAVDIVSDVLDRQIERFKGRRYDKGRKAGEREGAEVAPLSEDADLAQRVVRRKRFPVKPMSVEEAIDQMELLGHNFFLFVNSSNQKYNVVYRRRDGAYGLIEPAVG